MSLERCQLMDHRREQQLVIGDQLKTISRMEKQAKRYKEDQRVSGRLQVLHRMGSLIVVGGMDSLHTERVSRQRQSRSSLSSIDSSASSLRNSFFWSYETNINPPPPVPPVPPIPSIPPVHSHRPHRPRTTRQRTREM